MKTPLKDLMKLHQRATHDVIKRIEIQKIYPLLERKTKGGSHGQIHDQVQRSD